MPKTCCRVYRSLAEVAKAREIPLPKGWTYLKQKCPEQDALQLAVAAWKRGEIKDAELRVAYEALARIGGKKGHD